MAIVSRKNRGDGAWLENEPNQYVPPAENREPEVSPTVVDSYTPTATGEPTQDYEKIIDLQLTGRTIDGHPDDDRPSNYIESRVTDPATGKIENPLPGEATRMPRIYDPVDGQEIKAGEDPAIDVHGKSLGMPDGWFNQTFEGELQATGTQQMTYEFTPEAFFQIHPNFGETKTLEEKLEAMEAAIAASIKSKVDESLAPMRQQLDPVLEILTRIQKFNLFRAKNESKKLWQKQVVVRLLIIAGLVAIWRVGSSVLWVDRSVGKAIENIPGFNNPEDFHRTPKQGEQLSSFDVTSPYLPCKFPPADCRWGKPHRGADLATPPGVVIGVPDTGEPGGKAILRCKFQPDGAGLYAEIFPKDSDIGFRAFHLNMCAAGIPTAGEVKEMEIMQGRVFGQTGGAEGHKFAGNSRGGGHLHWEQLRKQSDGTYKVERPSRWYLFQAVSGNFHRPRNYPGDDRGE